MNAIRVMLVDDHDMVRRGLETLLDIHEDLVLAGEARDGEEAIQEFIRCRPDVILMDLRMPRMGGVEAIRAILDEDSAARIIALTSFKERDLVENALEAGATGYLLKNVSNNELAQAIRGVYAGESALAPEAARVLIEAATAPPPPGHDLTARELEVLALVAEGLSNRQIAERLEVRSSTVKNHVSSILSKLGASSRTEAATMALKHNLIK